MSRFKISRWVTARGKGGESRADQQKDTKHPRHRAHRYWSRQR